MYSHALSSLSLSRGKSSFRPALQALEAREVPAGAIATTFHLDNSWGSGMQGTITLKNSGDSTVDNWSVEFDYANTISSIWNAKIDSSANGKYKISHSGWNSAIAPGASVSFGFIGGANYQNNPAHFVVAGNGLEPVPAPVPFPAPTPAPTPAPAPSGNVAMTYKVTSDWGSGFVGEITLKNNGTTKLTSWKLQFDASWSIDSIWSAKLVSHQGNTYTIDPMDWNKEIVPGGAVTFGFTGHGVSSPAPTNVLINGISNENIPTPTPTPTPTPSPTPTPAPTNHAPVANADTVYVSSGSSVSISVLANDRDQDGDRLVVKSVTSGAFGTTAIQSDGTILYTPGSSFVGSDSFSYTVADPSGLASTATVKILKISEGVKAWPAQVFAPYVDTTLWPTFDLVKAAKDQGVRYFSLAFITASPANQPSWGGYSSYEINGGEFDLKMRDMIAGVRALGGDVNVSFGGANGHELADVITDRGALKAAYQKVIDAYGLTRIDFDIEGAAVNNKASLDRRTAVLAELQADAAKAGKSLEIWLTLPVLPTGLTPDGVYAVQSAFNAGVKLGGVNIMTMDYGAWAAPNPTGKMGDYAIQAANSLHGQLKNLYAGFSDTKLWSMVGMTPMIGMNDVTTEVFDQQEAREVLTFAQEKSIGKLSFWSLNRDMQNPNGAIGYVDTTSSSILQSPYEFSSIFKVFTSQSSVSPVTPAPTPAPAPLPAISVANVSVMEGNSGNNILQMDFTLSAPSSSLVSVNYMTEDVTANAGVDYVRALGTISFSPGETVKSLYLQVIGDTMVEGNETFSVLLAGASGATLVGSFATATISNDDVSSIPNPTPSPMDPTGDKKVVAYFTEWGIYGRQYEVSDLPADKLTHVNYAFAKITDQGEVGVFDSWAATEKPFGNDTWDTPLRGNYHALQVLKQQHPHLQTLISVGGWTLSDKFSDVALTAQSREKFAASAVRFARQYGFDGVDLDWEYPVSGGLASNVYRAEDGANYVELVREVRRQMEIAGAQDQKHYLLTIASPAGYDKIANFQLAAMAPSLDWFNVMTYDYHGTWENQTNHQSAMFASALDPTSVASQYNVDFSIQAYMDAGVASGKLVMGAPIYGRGWSGVTNANNGLFQNATGPASGTWEKGVFDYSDLLNKVQTQPDVYKVFWDDAAQVPYIWAPTVEGGMFSTYENPESIANRVDYIFANQLGGMMFWEASADVHDSDSPYSLIGTAARLLQGVGV